MQKRRFVQCDVFTEIPARGNGLAVVVDSEGLTDADMQNFAAWTNLAETTFLLPARDEKADYRVRIFTPNREMPFAGHPTLGSCAAWLHTGGQPRQARRVWQKCEIGLVEIDMSGDVPGFVAPPTEIKPLETVSRSRIIDALGIDESAIVSSAYLKNGPAWEAFELDSAADVLAVDSALVQWPEFDSIGLIGAYPGGEECDYEVRMLAPSSGMSEDPITGSLNAALARWLQARGNLANALVMSQGTRINRKGRVFITPDENNADRILIGGKTQILIEGTVKI